MIKSETRGRKKLSDNEKLERLNAKNNIKLLKKEILGSIKEVKYDPWYSIKFNFKFVDSNNKEFTQSIF